jgi:Rrf2 family protein
MLELARLPEEERVSARTLGDLADVSYPFARSIVTDLATAGLVDARRGPNGGVRLARSAADISVYDIVVAIEGGVCLNLCVTEPGYCTREHGCSAHGVWSEASSLLADYLASRDLASLVSE